MLDNRDIMLCLDVSGSMVEYNRSILVRFGELVAGFEGERIGMTIFNSSAVPAFPLTTDHRFVTEEFARFEDTFAARGIDALGGTLEGDGTSIVPDGIASCALGLPEDPDGRSRAMIVATDNIVEGVAALAMNEVTALLVQRDIRAYVLFPIFSFEPDRPAVVEMRTLATESGGQFFGTENPTAVASIIDQVEATEQDRLDVEPTRRALRRHDPVAAGGGGRRRRTRAGGRMGASMTIDPVVPLAAVGVLVALALGACAAFARRRASTVGLVAPGGHRRPAGRHRAAPRVRAGRRRRAGQRSRRVLRGGPHRLDGGRGPRGRHPVGRCAVGRAGARRRLPGGAVVAGRLRRRGHDVGPADLRPHRPP